jgi:hypothetical protein
VATDPLAGLSSQERFAALVVANAVGAFAEAHDVGGRQGAVDVLLTYPDGAVAALEVTSQAGAGVQQRNALTRNEVPNTGKWTWHISIGSVGDLPELLDRYARIIATSEALGITSPSRLYTRSLPSPDFEWLMESSVTMSGLPDVPADGVPHRQWIRILPQSDGGAIDETLAGLPDAVNEMLHLPNQARHVEKLRASELGETHLFIAFDEGSLPFAQRAALVGRPTALPQDGLVLPDGLTYVWFVSDFSHTLYGYGHGDWRIHPIDSMRTP